MARLRGRAYLELGEHRDPIGGEPPPRSADGVRETNSRGRYSGRRTASARRSLSARARPDATRRLPRARQSTKTRGLTSPIGVASHQRVFSLQFCEHIEEITYVISVATFACDAADNTSALNRVLLFFQKKPSKTSVASLHATVLSNASILLPSAFHTSSPRARSATLSARVLSG